MRMAIDPADITLSPQQRQALARLAEQTGKSHAELIDELLAKAASTTSDSPEVVTDNSLYDVLSERGMLGCFDGPTDLATNPMHMEGFGQNAWSDSD